MNGDVTGKRKMRPAELPSVPQGNGIGNKRSIGNFEYLYDQHSGDFSQLFSFLLFSYHGNDRFSFFPMELLSQNNMPSQAWSYIL